MYLTPTARPVSPGAESLIGRPLPCLDHGYVELLDYMGTDRDIALAARTTTGRDDAKSPEDDRGLIRYLVRHQHTTPLEMVRARFRLQMPIFVARQIIRHRMSSTNEYSLRYSEPIDAFYLPAADAVAAQSASNRQGRGDLLPPGVAERVRALMEANDQRALELYRELADDLGVARELARCVLPVSLYTRWVWSIDLHNLMRFLELRLDPHAQAETRAFADALASVVRAWVPVAWEAFADYRLGAVRLSRMEVEALARLLAPAGDPDAAAQAAGLTGRERAEFAAKIALLREAL